MTSVTCHTGLRVFFCVAPFSTEFFGENFGLFNFIAYYGRLPNGELGDGSWSRVYVTVKCLESLKMRDLFPRRAGSHRVPLSP